MAATVIPGTAVRAITTFESHQSFRLDVG